MNVAATSIDHHRADLSEREIFACSGEQAERLYEIIKDDPRISGAVLINTCNRTELYLSFEETGSCKGNEDRADGRNDDEGRTDDCKGNESRAGGCAGPDPFGLLCDLIGVDGERYGHLQKRFFDEDALRHLCLLASGAESQLWGDSQIITQVGDAISEARERGAVDSVLNTIFRLGITAGKEIRTCVDLYINDGSTAGMAAERLIADPRIETALVVGNGTIGRMVAQLLAQAGVDTFMTMRSYNHGQAVIPEGVKAVPYADRYQIMEDCDGVVSATSSPHTVITGEKLGEVKFPPKVIIDMAVPRDVEETVGEIEGIECYNIDDISGGHHVKLREDQLEKLEKHIERYIDEYRRWEASRDKVENRIRRLTDEDRDRADRKHFPLFMDSMDIPVLVIGGGNIAERRVMTMAEFGFDITIVSEDLTETLERMVEGKAAKWVRMRYDLQAKEPGRDPKAREPGGEMRDNIDRLLDSAEMVLACTNDRDVNRSIGNSCREKKILVNVCDARNESTFWFPAVALNDELTVAVVGRGTDHMNVKKAAAALRSVVENKRYK